MLGMLAAGWLLATVPIAISSSAPATVELSQRAVTVRIASVSGARTLIGSGVLIAQGRGTLTILTVGHIVQEGVTPSVSPVDGLPYDVLAIQRVPGHDLALIRAAAPFARSVAGTGRAAGGDPVFLWGQPRGEAFALARGMVVDVAPQFAGATDGRFTIACPACDSGDSGAGVFDAAGGVVGVLSAAIVDPAGHRLGIWMVEPVAAARPLLAGASAPRGGERVPEQHRD